MVTRQTFLGKHSKVGSPPWRRPFAGTSCQTSFQRWKMITKWSCRLWDSGNGITSTISFLTFVLLQNSLQRSFYAVIMLRGSILRHLHGLSILAHPTMDICSKPLAKVFMTLMSQTFHKEVKIPVCFLVPFPQTLKQKSHIPPES